MYELSILKEFINNRNSYINYRNFLRKEDINEDLKPIFDSVDEWYKNNTEAPAIEDVANITFSKPIKDGQREMLKAAMTRLDAINGVETVQNLLESFKTNRVLLDISSTAYDAQRGYKPVSEVITLLERLKEPTEFKIEFVTDDIEELLNNTYRKPGLRWRLSCLNRSLGSLRKGDFGFVFARPETGKTSFLASESTEMAGQLTSEDGPILWLNNEEQSEKVKKRCYQAALGWTRQEVDANPSKARSLYQEVIKDRILIPVLKTTNRREVEAIVNHVKPRLIILDQIDNITGFKADRKDLELGEMYKWARNDLTEDASVIGVCQADVTGENQRWLYMNNVANAKTEKQATADFIIGIGKIHDQGYEYMRFLNICKNKLDGDPDTEPSMNHAKMEVIFRSERARYEDI